jgi:hypothetical protein
MYSSFSVKGFSEISFFQFPANFFQTFFASDLKFLFFAGRLCSQERGAIICVPFFLSRAFQKSVFVICCEISCCSNWQFLFLNNLVPNSEGQLYADKPESQANLGPILAIQGYLRLKN